SLTGPVVNNDTFHQTFGTYNGVFTNNANFIYDGPGSFLGTYVHAAGASLTASAPFDAHNGIRVIGGSINNLVGGSVAGDGAIGVDIEGGAVNLAGGTLSGVGPLLNNGQITGFGTLAGNGGFTNNALLTITGGNVILSRTGGVNVNAGNISIDP